MANDEYKKVGAGGKGGNGHKAWRHGPPVTCLVCGVGTCPQNVVMAACKPDAAKARCRHPGCKGVFKMPPGAGGGKAKGKGNDSTKDNKQKLKEAYAEIASLKASSSTLSEGGSTTPGTNSQGDPAKDKAKAEEGKQIKALLDHLKAISPIVVEQYIGKEKHAADVKLQQDKWDKFGADKRALASVPEQKIAQGKWVERVNGWLTKAQEAEADAQRTLLDAQASIAVCQAETQRLQLKKVEADTKMANIEAQAASITASPVLAEKVAGSDLKGLVKSLLDAIKKGDSSCPPELVQQCSEEIAALNTQAAEAGLQPIYLNPGAPATASGNGDADLPMEWADAALDEDEEFEICAESQQGLTKEGWIGIKRKLAAARLAKAKTKTVKSSIGK